MTLRILLVTPALPGGLAGNAVTAARWAAVLRDLGHTVDVAERYDGEPCDVLVALHARRSAPSVGRYAEERPGAPLVVALTGTDLYGDLPDDPDARRSIELATRLVVLHERGPADVPEHVRDRARVVHQSVAVPEGSAGPDPERADGFVVCVVGHLRPVKDPLLAARAARRLPADSTLRVEHLGAALSPEMEAAARDEQDANPRYVWRGAVPRDEALRRLAASHLHVSTSRVEGGANAIGEAVALGVPTIATRISSSVGLLGEDYPGFVPVGDEDALADALSRAERDPTYLAELRRASDARAERFRPEREREEWRALLEELRPLAAAEGGRFVLHGEAPSDVREDFARDVAHGLAERPRSLPCRWLYDAEGSRLFEEICAQPEYYPTRAEAEILETNADAIVARADAPATCVELGSGSAVKTRHVLGALLRARDELEYVPVDISRAAVEESARDLLERFPRLHVTGVVGEYERGFEWMAAHAGRPKLVLWLGSNVGNLTREDAADFLRRVRACLTPRDRFLLGVDLRKDAAVLEAAYDDAAGVTARFDKNLLARINRELGGDFDLDAFAHEARYDAEAGRVDLGLRSLREQTVRIVALPLEVRLEQGERIHTEDSHKYAPEEIDALAAAGGFRVEERWLDTGGRFSVNLLRPVDAATPGPRA